MRAALSGVSPIVELARVTGAFAAVANAWFVVLWTRGNLREQGTTIGEPGTIALREEPLWLMLLGATAAALGLYAFASALNDILDIRRDRAFRPDRPLASGRLGIEAAVAFVVVSLLVAVLGATAFGMRAVMMCLLVASAILIFNAAGRFIPAIGLVLLGLVHAGHMVIPNTNLRFVWPVCLVMTHTLVVGGIVYVLSRKVPRVSVRAAAAALVGWAFWAGVLLVSVWRHREPVHEIWPHWVPPTVAIWPGVLAVLFGVLVWRRIGTFGRSARAAEKVARYGSLWLSFYGCAWLFAMGSTGEGWILLGLSGVGVIGMTVLRELYHVLEEPVGYRR